MKEQIGIMDILEMIKVLPSEPISSNKIIKMVKCRLRMLLTPSKLAQKKLSEMGIEYKN